MHNFVRALKQATSHWPSLLLATMCSVAVAALWGANIGAVLPILQVTINGSSIQEHVSNQIVASEATIVELQQLESDPELEFQLEAEQAKLAGLQRMQPWVARLPSSPFETVSLIVAALILSTLIKHLFLIANEYLVGRVALTISRDIRMSIFDKALRLDRQGYSAYGTAGFTAQITHTTEMLSNGIISALGAAIREPLKVMACLIGAGIICWRLLLLSVLVAPIVGWLLVNITRRIKSVAQRTLTQAEGFHDVMHESFGNIQTVQAYCMEDRAKDRFGETTNTMRNFGLKFILYSSMAKPIIEFLGLSMLGTTIIGGAYLVLNQETHLLGIPICDTPLSVEKLLVFFGMLIGISDPLRKLSAVYSTVYAGGMAADAMYPLLDRACKIVDPEEPQEVESPHGVLSLKNITFGYEPETPILKDTGLEIPFGSTIAIVGHNGSGKSTLINLLCRFYDPQSGHVQLDGTDIRDLRVQDVRGRVALVNQHTELFNESIAYNIRYGRPDATDEEVRQAAEEAHAMEFITSLDHGFETVVGQNGQNLSGGQRQRISLARAILCQPEILILDEATSQIDMHSEQLIRDSLAAHQGERTLIIITHREKLLELADHVIEVVDGKLCEIPNPQREAA